MKDNNCQVHVSRLEAVDAEILLRYTRDVSGNEGKALVIWRDPMFTGFLKTGDVVEVQPEGPEELNYHLVEDIRVIGKLGEWHVWRCPDGSFRARLRTVASENNMLNAEKYYLWGTDYCNDSGEKKDGWTCVTEKRGMRIYLPWAQGQTGLPAYLPVYHVVAADENGLAAIIDSFFVLPEQVNMV